MSLMHFQRDGQSIPVVPDNPLPVTSGAFGIPPHDHEDYVYDGSNRITSLLCRVGGPTGDVVATLTFTYDASGNLISQTRT